jgi:hypothetical protein
VIDLIQAELLRFFKHVQVCAHGRKAVPFWNMRTDLLGTTLVTQKEQAFAALAGVQVSYLQFKYPVVLQNAHCPSPVPVLADIPRLTQHLLFLATMLKHSTSHEMSSRGI